MLGLLPGKLPRQNARSNAQRGWRPRQRIMPYPMYYSPGWARCGEYKEQLLPEKDHRRQLHQVMTMVQLVPDLRAHIIGYLAGEGWARQILLPKEK